MPTLTTPDRTDRDLAALTVLAVLTAAPRRPDEIHQLLVDTEKDFVSDLPHSLHSAAVDLERDGHIVATQAHDETGQTLYEVTPAGREEVLRRIETLLRAPTADAACTYAAISFISLLPQERAVAALRSRAAELQDRISVLEAYLTQAEADQQLVIESDFELERLEAEERWMTRVANRVEIGALSWG